MAILATVFRLNGAHLATLPISLRESVRSLRRSPSFLIASVITLALGIGSFTALFAVVKAVLLRPLGYPEPDRLAFIQHPVPGIGESRRWGLSEAGYFFLAKNNRSFDGIAVYEADELGVGGSGATFAVQLARVSSNVFTVLGGHAMLGRLLNEEDNRYRTPRPPTAVLGHSLWTRAFGGRSDVLGKTVLIEGDPVEIVGVMEPGFGLPDITADLWLPAAIDPTNAPENWHRFHAIARLKAGVSFDQAEEDLDRLTSRFVEAMPRVYDAGFMNSTRFSTVVEPLRRHVTGSVGRTLWVVLAAVTIVLLIATANFASLWAVRIESRAGEVRVRAALGATMRKLGERYLGEVAILSLVGGATGFALALAGIPILVASAPPDTPRLTEIGVGWDEVLVSVSLSLLIALVVGIPTISRATKYSTGPEYRTARTTASRQQHRIRSLFVCMQVALALVLISTAGLLLKTSHKLWSVHPGFEPNGVLAMDLLLPSAVFRDERAVAQFHQTIAERIRIIPGVQYVGSTTSMPLYGRITCALIFTDDPEAEQRNRSCFANPVRVSPGYFEAMGIPLRGRPPNWPDADSTKGEVVISHSVAQLLWGARDPIGRGIRANNRGASYYRIVGVAGDVLAEGLDKAPVLRVYFPMAPVAGAPLWGPALRTTLTVRTARSRPTDMTSPIRTAIQDVAPTVAIGRINLVQDLVARSMARTLFAMLVIGVAASVGLILAVVGLYGVVAYIAVQRRREIGIRIALGASPHNVTGIVIRQSLYAVAGGMTLGIIGALATGRAVKALLFGVAPSDPAILLGGAVILAGTAALASWLPARRAARVDPLIALRAE